MNLLNSVRKEVLAIQEMLCRLIFGTRIVTEGQYDLVLFMILIAAILLDALIMTAATYTHIPIVVFFALAIGFLAVPAIMVFLVMATLIDARVYNDFLRVRT